MNAKALRRKSCGINQIRMFHLEHHKCKFNLIKNMGVLLLLVGLIAITRRDIYAEADYGEEIIMVSMGDSYSAGEGIEKFYGQDLSLADKVKNKDWLAHRSEESWPGQLKLKGADKYMKNYKINPETSGDVGEGDAIWRFVAVSGAETKDFYAEQKKNYNKLLTYIAMHDDPKYEPTEQEKSQYVNSDNLPEQMSVFSDLPAGEVDYVTLTIGGNDVGFSDIIKECVLGSTYLNMSHLTNKLWLAWELFYTPGYLRDTLTQLYADIETRAGSQANILVVGYPKLLDQEGKGKAFSKDEAYLVNASVSRFNNEIQTIVDESEGNIFFVSVEDKFNTHEAYSKTPFINPVYILPKGEDIDDNGVSAYSIHPNKEGAEAYAACVQDAIDWIEAGKRSNVSGKIVDKNDKPAEGLTVTISSSEKERVLFRGETDADGSFNGKIEKVSEKVNIEISDEKGVGLLLARALPDSIGYSDNDLGTFKLNNYEAVMIVPIEEPVSERLKSFAEKKTYAYGKSFDAPNLLRSENTYLFDNINYSYIPSDCSLGYEIIDFDNDGQDELLMLALTEDNKPVFEMYECKGGNVVLAAREMALCDSLPVYLSDDYDDSGYYDCFVYGADNIICFETHSCFDYMMMGVSNRIETLRYSEGSFAEHRFNDISGSGPAPESFERRRAFLEGMGLKSAADAMYGVGYHYIYELISSPLVFAQGDIYFSRTSNAEGAMWFNCWMECLEKSALPGQQNNGTIGERDNSPYVNGKVWEAVEGKTLAIKNDAGEIVDTLLFNTLKDGYDNIIETRLVFDGLSLSFDEKLWAESIRVFAFDANDDDQTVNILMTFKHNNDQEYARLFAVDQSSINRVSMPSDNSFRRNFLSLSGMDGSGTMYNYLQGNYDLKATKEETARLVFEKQTYQITDTSVTETDSLLGTLKAWTDGHPEDFQEGVKIHLNKDMPYYQDEECTIAKGTLKMGTDIVVSSCNAYGHTFYAEKVDGWFNGYELVRFDMEDMSTASTLRMMPFAHE